MAVAKPKINDLEEQRVSILRAFMKSFQLDLLGCKRLERSLFELFRLPEFEASARVSMGLLSAMKRNSADSDHHLNRAAALDGEHAVAIPRISAALHCGRMIEAATMLQQMEIVKEPARLRQMMTHAMQVGLLSIAEECLVELEKMNLSPAVEKCNIDPDCVHELRTATKLLKDAGVSDWQLVERVAVANKVVAECVPDHPFVVYGFGATADAGIFYEFPLSLPVDELVELDWKISEALVDAFDEPYSDLIGFATRPFSDSLRCVA